MAFLKLQGGGVLKLPALLGGVLSIEYTDPTDPIEEPPGFALDGYKPSASDTDNIALNVGTSGEWDDYSVTPSAMIVHAGTIYMYYSGSEDNITWYFGLATAPVAGFTGKNWTRHPSNPIASFLGFTSVVFDSVDGIWKGWYYGDGSGVGYATAENPEGPWTDYVSNPVMTGSDGWELSTIFFPRIWKRGLGDWVMLYTGGNSVNTNSKIGLATSADGITWTKYASNPVLGPSGSDWMQETVFLNTPAISINGIYHIYFNGKHRAESPDNSRIGHATSTDLITWTVDASSAGAIINGTRSWEGGESAPGEVEWPTYIQVGSVQYIFYDTWWGSPKAIGFVVIP